MRNNTLKNLTKPILNELQQDMLKLPKIPETGILLFHFYTLKCYGDICESYLFESLLKINNVLRKLQSEDLFVKDENIDLVIAELGEAIYEAGELYDMVMTSNTDYTSTLEDVITPYYNLYLSAFGIGSGKKRDKETFFQAVNKQIIDEQKKELKKISAKPHWPKGYSEARAKLLSCYEKLTDDSNSVYSCHNEYLTLRTLMKKTWNPVGVSHIERDSSTVSGGLEYIMWFKIKGSQYEFTFNKKKDRGGLSIFKFVKR